ncbi:ATP-binding protein [Sporanaerobium hydrogeniformans]|uniref:ATP-binding protein n=1 Tax=Sporanaerobium hydrogeniformans TaxID=3072179 RepID=UPI0015D51457|nr:ATP-binding protein [Sporanaerobium hydrogeniformans]
MDSKVFQYKKVVKDFDTKRMRAIQAQKARAEEVYLKVPEIKAIDEKLQNSGIKLVRTMLNAQNASALEDFRRQSEDLLLTKKMLLVEAGYNEAYLDVHYHCPHCKDTGFIGDKKCTCFKQALISIAYEQSNIKNILQVENFHTFSLKYYEQEINPKFNLSPYQNMAAIRDFCVAFIEKFDTDKQNLIFHGPTGLGKTFLCNCIAKELLDLGFTVLYLTATQLFKLFQESRFHREDMEETEKDLLSTLFSVDLLIIDDLGTESSSTFIGPDLFDVLNGRFLNQLSTIISTNLEPHEWNNYYSDRIVSRIIGNYIAFPFFGTDIRFLKKYHR